MELNDRKKLILKAIIANYLETGEPVGSRTIAKHPELNLSSATIRNEMADLEDALREEACLNSFISGYRLAQGIQQELLADQPPYNFENEDEQRACELAGKER